MSVKYARRPSRKEQTEIDIGSATPREIQAKHIVILTGHAEKSGHMSLARTKTLNTYSNHAEYEYLSF